MKDMFNGRRKLVTSVARMDPLPWKISPFNKSGSPKKRPAASMMLMWLIMLAGRCSMYICTYVIWMSYGYVAHKNHVAQNATMIRYSFTTPRSAPSKANTDPKSTLWNLWSFWVFKKRNTTWACTSSLPGHSDLGPPTTLRTSMWDFLVREKYLGLPRKQKLLILMLLFLLSSLLLLPLFLDLTFQHLVLFCGVNIQVRWWSYVPKVRNVYQSHFTTKVSLPVS